MKPRKIFPSLVASLEKSGKKIVFLWGARQTGKSTILNQLYETYGGSYFNFDNLDDQRLFVPELVKLESTIALKSNKASSPYIFIDEVQKYPESTQSIKLLADNTKYTIIATGSSEMRAKTNRFDTLAGRYTEFVLFPLTIDEFAVFHDKKMNLVSRPSFAEKQVLSPYLEEMMVFGSYPGVALSEHKIEELKNISQNSIIKDIVAIYDLKNTDLVYNLLRMLAMQIGNLINVTELASSLGTTKITIANYLSILQKNRIVYFLEPFRSNKRRAYSERKKIYFIDLGIRNTLIEDFRPMSLRPDFGAVFENVIIMGVLRQIQYQRNNNNLHFFREIAGAQNEIDLIMETPEGVKRGFEVKFGGRKIQKFPELDIADYVSVTRENAVDYLV